MQAKVITDPRFNEVVGNVIVPAMPAYKICECWRNKDGERIFSLHRHDKFYRWFSSALLPAAAALVLSGFEIHLTMTEEELTAVGKPFKSFLSIEFLILCTEAGAKTGLRRDGYGNLFFVEIDSSVFMVSAYWYRSEGWMVLVDEFCPTRQWVAERRFFSGN